MSSAGPGGPKMRILPVRLISVLLIGFGLTACDQGPVGRFLRRRLVETPARLLSNLSRGQLLGLTLVLLLGGAAAFLFEAEGLRLFSMAAPELTTWVMVFDVTVVFDMAVLALTLQAVARGRDLNRILRRVFQTVAAYTSAVGRRRRTRRRSKPRATRPDADDAGPGLVFA